MLGFAQIRLPTIQQPSRWERRVDLAEAATRSSVAILTRDPITGNNPAVSHPLNRRDQ